MCWQADIPPEPVVNVDETNVSIMPYYGQKDGLRGICSERARSDVRVGHDTGDSVRKGPSFALIIWQDKTARFLPEVKKTLTILNDFSETHSQTSTTLLRFAEFLNGKMNPTLPPKLASVRQRIREKFPHISLVYIPRKPHPSTSTLAEQSRGLVSLLSRRKKTCTMQTWLSEKQCAGEEGLTSA
eukprot:3316600-Amphidinium_carterae.3